MKKDGGQQNLNEENEKNSTRSYFYAAFAALVAAVAALGCAFIPGAGVYMLIASVLLELTTLSLLSAQKRKNNFKGVFFLTVAAYIFLGISAALFAGGLVYVAVTAG